MTRRPVEPEKIGVCIMMQALAEGSCSIKDLREVSGMSDKAIRRWLYAWRQFSWVRICGFEKDTGGHWSIRLYKWEPGVRDASPPKRTPAQRAKDYRSKKKRNLLYFHDVSARTQ